jgi:hypothetical protein
MNTKRSTAILAIASGQARRSSWITASSCSAAHKARFFSRQTEAQWLKDKITRQDPHPVPRLSTVARVHS